MGVFYDLARASNLIDLMEVYRTTSKDFLPVFTDMNRKLDLLHIDGNHSTEQAMYDVVNYTPFIKSGGYLVMDDMDWPSLETVIEYIERTLKYEWVDAITHNGNRCSCGIYRKVK
jgi:predicted O-methyltransferase YrrM